MKKLNFLWHYLTDPSFRRFVDREALQKYINAMQKAMYEKAKYESRTIYQIDPGEYEKYHITHDGFIS